MVAMALIGGAVLARYMLPAAPLVIILGVSTLWRRLSYWRAAVAFVALAFVAGVVLESSLWILAGGQSRLSRLCRAASGWRAFPGSSLSHGAGTDGMAGIR